jgi:hypothetical protein
VYLNDDYDGGETEMPEIGFSHKGRRGEGFYFVNVLENGKPDRRTLHAGRSPKRGEKWVVSQFIRKPTHVLTGANGRRPDPLLAARNPLRPAQPARRWLPRAHRPPASSSRGPSPSPWRWFFGL